MAAKPILLCLSGSLRRQSSNTALLSAMAESARDIADCRLYEQMGSLPIFNPDLEGADLPGPVRELLDQVEAAAGLVIACPEYAHGIPGGLKKALDWLVSGDEFYGKPVMLVHANGQGRGDFVRAALTEVLKTMGARLVVEDGASIYLVSKGTEALEAILSRPDSRAKLRAAVDKFLSVLD